MVRRGGKRSVVLRLVACSGPSAPARQKAQRGRTGCTSPGTECRPWTLVCSVNPSQFLEASDSLIAVIRWEDWPCAQQTTVRGREAGREEGRDGEGGREVRIWRQKGSLRCSLHSFFRSFYCKKESNFAFSLSKLHLLTHVGAGSYRNKQLQ